MVIVTSFACKQKDDPPLVVHVLRDPSAPFAKRLRQADWQFVLTKPRLGTGQTVMVATNEGSTFSKLLRRLADSRWDLIILNSASDLPDGAAVRDHSGPPQLICGGAPAYVPDWVLGEEREATEMYLRFLTARCEGNGAP